MKHMNNEGIPMPKNPNCPTCKDCKFPDWWGDCGTCALSTAAKKDNRRFGAVVGEQDYLCLEMLGY